MEIELTEKAKELIFELKKLYQNLSMVIENTSCCSNSSIFVRDNLPSGEIIFLKEIEGVKIFLDPSLKSLLNFNKLIIDVMDFTDDSLSLETNLGKRLILLAEKS